MRTKLAKVVAEREPSEEVPPIREPGEDEIQRMIAEAAYYRAERRGFAPGQEDDDWREAELEVRGSLRGLQSRI